MLDLEGEGEVRAYPLQILIRSTTDLVAENAASSPISVRRKQHMYSIETPEAEPVPSTFRDPVIPESTDARLARQEMQAVSPQPVRWSVTFSTRG